MGEVVVRGFDALGWHWWPMPCAILAEGYDGRLACNNCGACQSGCPRGSLNDMAVTHWPKALAAGVELRTDSRVERIETDASGRATGVVYVERNTGVRHIQSADIVILAANGVGTPRLLLLSESAAHPNGLANRSDQVGRNLMHHTLGMVECWVDAPTESHKGLISAIAICEEFAESDTSRGFVNGFTLHIVRQNGAGYQALGSHSGNVAPWGADHHAWFARHFGHGIGILIVGDDLPRPDNRVTLSDTVVDSSGLPAPRIAYGMCENDARLARFGIDRAIELAGAMDAWDVKVNPFRDANGVYAPPAWHLLGTARMGAEPETSVVTKWHQAWDCPNLYITDGSVMATGAAINPTSTISALAYRAAHHLADNFVEATPRRPSLARRLRGRGADGRLPAKTAPGLRCTRVGTGRRERWPATRAQSCGRWCSPTGCIAPSTPTRRSSRSRWRRSSAGCGSTSATRAWCRTPATTTAPTSRGSRWC